MYLLDVWEQKVDGGLLYFMMMALWALRACFVSLGIVLSDRTPLALLAKTQTSKAYTLYTDSTLYLSSFLSFFFCLK